MFGRRVDREHGQRPGLRQTGGDVGAQFDDQLAPGRWRVARRMRRNDHARQLVAARAQARRAQRRLRRRVGGRARPRSMFALFDGRPDRRRPPLGADLMDVVALASILVGARRVAAFLIGLDQRAIGDLLARIDFQHAHGGDDRRLFDRAVRLRLDIGRQRRQEFGAQRRALARQPALESFAVGGQTGEQVAAIGFAGGGDVHAVGRTDRRLKAAQIDRHVARTEDDLGGRRFQQPHVGGDFGGADAKQQLAKIAGLPRAIDFFPEEGARLLTRSAPARTIEQQVGEESQSQTRQRRRVARLFDGARGTKEDDAVNVASRCRGFVRHQHSTVNSPTETS